MRGKKNMKKHKKFLNKINKMDKKILELHNKRNEYKNNYFLSLAKFKVGDVVVTTSGKTGIIKEIISRDKIYNFDLNDCKIFYKIIRYDVENQIKIIKKDNLGYYDYDYFSVNVDENDLTLYCI